MIAPIDQTPATKGDLSSEQAFPGFEPLTSNYLYCPNQFFDVCLPNCSRGAVRIVAYMLRETLGWLDKYGNPRRQEIKVSYRDLIEKAGVSRGAIGPALKEVIDGGFITCVQTGHAKSAGQSAQTAEFVLRWDLTEVYAKAFQDFNGFYTGEGYRTPVPNRFFDSIIRNESLSVTKVVGTVIRHTIGYQNQFGGRRQEAPLSYRQIANFTHLSNGKTLAQAIQIAKGRGFIEVREAGKFSHERELQQATRYGIRWQQQAEKSNNGSIIPSETDRFKNPTRNGSKSPAEDRFKKPSSIRKTVTKDILKQQTVVAAKHSKTIQRLIDEGLDQQTALMLEQLKGAGVIERQLDWLNARKPDKNRIGMLRKAIEEDWSKPDQVAIREKQQAIRQREQLKNESVEFENVKIQEMKKERSRKKERLLTEWGSASREERVKWVQAAFEIETSKMIADMIRRQSTDTAKPHPQVLNVVAKDRMLPCLF